MAGFREERWSQEETLRRSAPFAVIMLLGLATLPVGETGSAAAVWASCAVAALLLGGVILLPWERFPSVLTLAPPFVSLLLVGLLRYAEGGAVSGYSVLLLVPVLWLALYGTRRELIAMIVGVALVLILPILIFGDPEYPTTEWRKAILVTAVAVFVGLVTQGLITEVRTRSREQERRSRRDREREAYLRTVMNSASEGILAVDGYGRITFANPAAAVMFGYSVEALMGARMHPLVHHSYPDGSHYPEDDCPIMTTINTGRESVVSDEVFWRKDGSAFPVEYRATPRRADGDIAGTVITFADITERLAVERLKNEFVSVVSHELRTPLTSIRGSLGLMEGGVMGELSDDAKRMLGIAISNADRLVRLINDILDVERIESGQAPMEMRSCDLGELMESTRELLQTSAGEAGVKLDVEPLQARLHADPDRIIQTLVNLVGNAIKFSPSGGTVTVRAQNVNGRVHVEVHDDGPGIPATARESIFDRFAQLDTADTRLKGGSGLGLAIARGIVEHHGGRIWVDSTEGEGSTFAFELPAAREREAEAVPSGPGRLGALVVEDDPDLSEVLLRSLRSEGIMATQVSTVEDALHVLRDRSPEVIVLDLILPGEHGDAVIDWLRDRDRLGESAIVVYTARDLDAAELEELRSVAEVITKSRVTPGEFEERLMETLHRARAGND